MKKITGALLMMVLILSLIAACSNTSNNNNVNNGGVGAETPSTTEAPPSNQGGNTTDGVGGAASQVYKFDEKKTFTMLTESHASWPYDPEWLIWDLIEEQTNATFKVEVPAGKIDETISLTIAGGNLPDIMYMPNYSLANKYGDQGALANILDYVDVMPNFKKWMEEHPSETQLALSADGSMYIFPNEGFGETNRQVWLYREDILSKHNLKMPSNYDELYEVLKELKKHYPDSYPLTFRGGFLRFLNFAANFETSDTAYYNFEEKKWQFGSVEDNFKRLVEYFRKFNEEGLIPPDFLTIDTKAWQDMMSTDQSFITVDYIGRIDFFNVPMREQNPEFNLAHMAPPAGLQGGKQQNPYVHFLQSGLTVASTSDQIEDVMRFMDYFYTEQGRDTASWGKEGVTYNIVDGKKQMTDEYADITDLRKKTGLATNGTYTWIDYDAHLSLASEELQAAYAEARKYDSKMQPLPALSQEEIQVNTLVGDAITKYQQQTVAKFILGELGLDQWDTYVEKMNELGLQQLLDIKAAAYERAVQAGE